MLLNRLGRFAATVTPKNKVIKRNHWTKPNEQPSKKSMFPPLLIKIVQGEPSHARCYLFSFCGFKNPIDKCCIVI